jgi:hypothetical protein
MSGYERPSEDGIIRQPILQKKLKDLKPFGELI